MRNEARRNLWAGICVLFFIGAQSFQELAYRFWIPPAGNPQDELLAYLRPIDEARSLLVMAAILGLLVPFVVIAIRYFKTRPVLSVLGLLCGAAFVGFELSHRSVDFWVIGMRWAKELQSASSAADRDAIVQRFALWNEVVHGWYFPLLISYLAASGAFLATTAEDWRRGGWFRLAPIAFGLNALRLCGRLLSMYLGQAWLNPLSDNLYFPAVLVINSMLVIWFFFLAKEAKGATVSEIDRNKPAENAEATSESR